MFLHNIKRIFFKPIAVDLFVIFILSLTPLLWFQGNSVMIGHDNVFPLDPITFLSGRLSTWIDQGFGQSQALIMGTIPIHFIDALPSLVGFDIQTTQKIVYVFWFFLIGISAYILAHVLKSNSRIFKLSAVLLYQFNFFILQGWWVGERTKFSAYIAFPLIIAVLFRVYWNTIGVWKAAIYISLILFVFNGGGLFGISLYGGFFVAVLVFILFFSILSLLRKDAIVVKRLFLVVALSFFGFLLTNAYYIFPAVFQAVTQYKVGIGKGGGITGFIDWAGEISANASIINIFRLQGISEWYDNLEHPYAKYFFSSPFLVIGSFVFPIFTFLSLMLPRKKQDAEIVLYLFLVYLVGIFFTAGTHSPLGVLYEWLMEHIPGSIAFRSPYFKFAPAVFLSTAFLIAYFIDYFRGYYKKIIFIFFICFILLYHFPYFTGEFFSWRKGFSTRSIVPEYIFGFEKWLNEEKKDDERVLLLPSNNPDFQYSTYEWGYLSFQSLPTLFSNKSIVINNDRVNDEEKKLLYNLYSAIANGEKELMLKISSLLRIKYFVLQSDVVFEANSTIPIDPQVYRAILENNSDITRIATFGKWTVYKINNDRLFPKIFATSNMSILSGSIKDVRPFYNLFQNENVFTLEGDFKQQKNRLHNRGSYFYVPECLICKEKDSPFIKIPERNILPDSPLYSLLLFNENFSLHKKNAKSLVYDYLGISLKRVGEVREMSISGKTIPEDLVSRFNTLLRNIKATFLGLEKLEDKLQVANDIKFYMENERSAISELFGIYATQGDSVVKLGRVIQGISSLLDTIDPSIFKPDVANNKLYQVTIDASGRYDLFFKTEDFPSIVKGGGKVSFLIDNKTFRETEFDINTKQVSTLSFKNVLLSMGDHNIKFSFPQVPNLSDGLKPSKTEFNSNTDIACYTARVNNFDYRKLYRVQLSYRNDFSTDLFFYIWHIKPQEKKLVNTFLLRYGFTDQRFARIIETNSDVKGVEVGVCSRGLVDEFIQKKMFLNMHEMINPVLLIAPVVQTPPVMESVQFTRLSATKYVINLKNSNPFILYFMERYDKGWKLSGFEDTHFRSNGYANGWIIDSPLSEDLILEYKPQKIFYYGSAVSIISLLGGILYLVKEKLKYDRKQQ